MKTQDLERASGVGRETIRFYVREGRLPQPERASRNVAWYEEGRQLTVRRGRKPGGPDGSPAVPGTRRGGVPRRRQFARVHARSLASMRVAE
jgi:hypothetical protein